MKHLLVLVTVAVFVSCTAPPPPPTTPAEPEVVDISAIKKQFQAMDDIYAKAQASGDAEGVAAYYSDDAYNLPDGAPTVKGKAAIIKRLKEEMAANTESATTTFSVQEAWAEGDLAVYIGHSTTTMADGSKETGKYVSIMRRGDDGNYLCIRDIWNSDTDDDDDGE